MNIQKVTGDTCVNIYMGFDIDSILSFGCMKNSTHKVNEQEMKNLVSWLEESGIIHEVNCENGEIYVLNKYNIKYAKIKNK